MKNKQGGNIKKIGDKYQLHLSPTLLFVILKFIERLFHLGYFLT